MNTNTDSFADSAEEVSVLVVDDHALWRDGVRSVLEDTEFRIVGEASSGKEALVEAARLNPQVVLLDIRMAGGDGLETLHVLKQRHPRMAVHMLTTYENPTYMARAVAGGASGYLAKGVDHEELLGTMRAVVQGGMLLTREDLARSLRSVGEHAAASDDLIEPLTRREEEVLNLVATGLNNREIGEILFVSERTIKTHVEHIIGKLSVSDRVQAAVWAARHGMVQEQPDSPPPG